MKRAGEYGFMAMALIGVTIYAFYVSFPIAMMDTKPPTADTFADIQMQNSMAVSGNCLQVTNMIPGRKYWMIFGRQRLIFQCSK